MRLIDADALREKMYYEAFETDSDMQKWESGCWIRYKMFENIIDSMSTIETESDKRLGKIEELVEGTIEHFDRDDAMDLLYQIKEVINEKT